MRETSHQPTLAGVIELMVPRDIKVSRERQSVQITWADGVIQTLGFAQLRKKCPCAECRTENDRQRETLFPILKKDPGNAPLGITSAQLVGNYALQIFWSDGHSTGIYDFRYLRQLGETNSTS